MKICLFLLLAGLLDAVFTNLGITSGIIDEGNPFMKYVIHQSWLYFYLIKVCLPLLLIGLFYFRPLKGWTQKLLISASVLYFLVLCYHLVWIMLYW